VLSGEATNTNFYYTNIYYTRFPIAIVEIVIIGNKYDIVMFAYSEVNNICGISIIIDFIKIKN